MARKKRERQKVNQSKVSSSARNTKNRSVVPSNLSERSFNARRRALHALADMRHGASMSRAAHDHHVTPRTIKQYAGSALVQERSGGRIRATKSDPLVRGLQIPGPNGPIEIDVGSKAASEFAKYQIDVNRFLGGNITALANWHGRKIAGIELITAGRTLKSLAEKDLLPYSLYRSLSGGAV